MTRPTLSDLSPRYQAQVAAQLADVKHPRTVKIEPAESLPSSGKRIRQSGRAPSKLELAFAEWLRTNDPRAIVVPHGITLRIANGCKYTPDFIASSPSSSLPIAYEVKGPHAWDDSIVKLKVAANQFPWIRFFLASRPNRAGAWRIEEVLP